MAYSAKVMEHFSNPHNVGEIKDADGVGEVGNPKCGDIMRMYIKVDNDVITDVKFMTFGCGAAIATSSMATDLVKGKTIPEALKLTNKAVMEALDGLPAIKIHCSVLAEQAIKAAVSDYYRRRGIDPTPIVGEIKVTLKDAYSNMKEMILPHQEILDVARAAMRKNGVEPVTTPIRGGTDGARLSFMGLPCPNLCTGGELAHGRNEFAVLEEMETIVEIVKSIAELVE